MAGRPAYLLFDLDETLYPSSCGLMQELSVRMTAFVTEFLGVGETEATRIRRHLRLKYGTTLTGLMREYGLAVAEQYLAYTHDVPLERFLAKDPQLAAALASLRLPKSVLTNSPKEHAERVLDRLGVREEFEHIFDLRFNELAGKPDAAVYTRVLAVLARPAPEVLLIDNHLDYLEPFLALGGQVLLINEPGCALQELPPGVPCLRDIKELPAFLAAG